MLSGDDEITEFVKPFAMMISHLITSLASPADQKGLSDAEYTIIRCKKIPHNIQSGDCGVYAIKYIECLALEQIWRLDCVMLTSNLSGKSLQLICSLKEIILMICRRITFVSF